MFSSIMLKEEAIILYLPKKKEYAVRVLIHRRVSCVSLRDSLANKACTVCLFTFDVQIHLELRCSVLLVPLLASRIGA